jgi:hypothetical protein
VDRHGGGAAAASAMLATGVERVKAAAVPSASTLELSTNVALGNDCPLALEHEFDRSRFDD